MPQSILQRSFNINTCIYCGGEGKTNEHVLPLALGGEMLLKKASCEPCRDLTSRCERELLNNNLAEARACLNYPSRRRDFENETFPLQVTLKDGSEKVLLLSNKETLGLVQFLELAPPGFFNPSKYSSGSTVLGVVTIGFGFDLNKLVEKYGIKQVTQKVKFSGNFFERMVARIAYCYVVAFWGLDCLEKCYILPAILGTKDDVGMWVGSDPKGIHSPIIGKVPGSNAMKLAVFTETGDGKRHVMVKLKFFAESDAPEYLVVVGSLKTGFEPNIL